MRNRLFIIGGIILGVSALVVALILMLGNNSEPEPEPTSGTNGSITLPDGTIDPQENIPEDPDAPRNPDGTLVVDDPHLGHDGHMHIDEIAECGEGPYSLACGDEEFYEMPAPAALAAGSEATKRFAEAWVTIIPGEDAATRSARIQAAGGTAAVAEQAPALSRPNTTLSSLTTESVPYGQMYAAFTRVQGGNIVYVLSLTAYATYTLADTMTQNWTMPGTMLVSVDPATYQVTAVTESFPNLVKMP